MMKMMLGRLSGCVLAMTAGTKTKATGPQTMDFIKLRRVFIFFPFSAI
jgi:hypothetical protein